ncbi:MAG: DUF3098 domain-containing protein [Bacteroidales bacterium]|nr:DUF3098 domain-containing protein [Bacteroidales bacterium]
MNFILDMEKDNEKMPVARKGIKLLIIGVLVMIAGYILMIGGGSDDPAVFNDAMFDFRRLVAAPVVIICGIVVVTVAIMKTFRK